MRSFVCTVVAYYRLLLRLLLNLGGDGAYLYGGDELGVWALLVLMRNMPPMPEAKAKCPSQVFRRLDMGACRCVRAKLLLYNALVWMSPFIGLVATGAFAMFRRCTFQKSYWMLLFRPDLVAFAMTQRWTKHFGDYWGADRQFSRVDLHRAYSLIIRSAYHVVDVNECPDQGRLEDKAFFQEAGARLGVPVVTQIPHRALPSVPDEDYPLFAKPATLQWGEGVLEIAHRGDDGYVKALADPECIVQRRLANRRDMQPMFPPRAPLCTARITTFRTKQGVKILEAWLRVGASDALADQFENGGATFAVYAESGVVWHGSTAAAMTEGSPELEPSLGRAPGASRDIAGHALPLWSDAIAMVKTAHETLAPNAFSVGWDVVLGEEHVRVLEGNLASMVALHVGMRYGTMALVWPDSPLFWLALSEWLWGRREGFAASPVAKKRKLQAVQTNLQRLIRDTERERDRLKARMGFGAGRSVGKAVANAQQREAMQVRLMHREGELFGLAHELAFIKEELLSI